MKIFLKRFILFVCFFSFFYFGCVSLWGLIFPSNIAKNIKYKLGSYSHLNRIVQDLASFTDVDILFLGTSRTYRGFDPRIFMKDGIKSFNLASSSQTPIQTEVLVNQYLHSLNPKLVVYEVFPEAFSNDGVESALDLIANGRIDFDYQTLKMALAVNHITVYNTLIYGMIRDLLNLDNKTIKIHRDKYIKGGFWEREISFFENNEVYPLKKLEFANFQKKAFERTLRRLKKLKINVVLVQAPLAEKLYNSYTNNSEIDDYFKSLTSYYNFNDILKLSSTKYFYDSLHLNQDGVQIFNYSLLYILKNTNQI
jgi:hypothetical protein